MISAKEAYNKSLKDVKISPIVSEAIYKSIQKHLFEVSIEGYKISVLERVALEAKGYKVKCYSHPPGSSTTWISWETPVTAHGLTKTELLEKLKECSEMNPESGHSAADDLLLKYINDPEITEAFESLTKWYA